MAEKVLADTEVRAPFAGYVSARAATPGEYVSHQLEDRDHSAGHFH